MDFNEVIGQKEAIDRLKVLADNDRVPHAMMLCGPQGSGKMAIAIAFASYMLTRGIDDELRLRQANAMLSNYEHPDLHFSYPVIRPAGTSAEHKMISDDFSKEWHEMLKKDVYFTMDHWLTAMNAANQQAQIGAGESDDLIHKLSLKSSQGGYKVSIIWLPERMNGECANKLLKLLEEPPYKTLFIMVCEQPEKLIDTIRSRVQRFDIRRIDDESLKQALITRRGLDEDMANRIAHIANGNWNRALDNLDANNDNRQFFDMFVMFMRMTYKRDVRELKKWTDVVATYGREKQRRMLQYFMNMVRESFMYNFHKPELCYMTQAEEQFAKNFARFINEANVVEINELLERCFRDIGQNANAKVVFFDMALNMIVLLIRK